MKASSSFRRRFNAIEWPLIGFLGALALGLGFWGFSLHERTALETPTWRGRLYLSLQLFAFQSGAVVGNVSWQLEVARFLAPAVALYTALQAAGVIFRDQLFAARIARLRDHAIVCGLGRKGLRLARDLAAAGERVIVIEKQPDADAIQAARYAGVLVLQGDASDPEILLKARADRARLVVAVCGRDGVNVDIAANMDALRGGVAGRPVLCAVHVSDPALCDLLKEREITGGSSACRMQYFNEYQLGAFVLIKRHPPFEKPIEGAAAPHVVIVGLGRFGERLLLLMAAAWAARAGASPQRFRATIVDREGEARVEAMRMRYPQLADLCEMRVMSIDTASPEFARGAFVLSPQGVCDVAAVYVCLDDEVAAMAASLQVNASLHGHAAPVVVRLADESGLGRLLSAPANGAGAYRNLNPFGLLEAACSIEIVTSGTREILARAIHASYVSERRKHGETPATNPSVAGWNDLPEALKDSNRRQADHIGAKLEAVGRRIAPMTGFTSSRLELAHDEIERLAMLEHQRWEDERRGEGWTYGPTKDLAQKKSPYLVPWENLAPEIREIDREMVRRLPAFLAEVGFEIREIDN